MRLLPAALAFAGVVAVGGCRQDMHDQPKYIPLRPSDFFADGRSARPPVEGTVARGQLRDDVHLYTGMIDGKPAETFPFPVTREVLERGRQRFNAICAPCHSRLGDGNGIIVQRGYRRPESFHTDRLRKAAVGYYFDVMTRGFGAMPDYAPQVTPQDRWAIAAYIRALQFSQRATLDDVPAAERKWLEQTRGEGMTPAPEVPQPPQTGGGTR
ncbi:MAG TPA: cytochrome c [Terriglobales bacterium]|nr:cytochrome c [Terriglobales bacterium]